MIEIPFKEIKEAEVEEEIFFRDLKKKEKKKSCLKWFEKQLSGIIRSERVLYEWIELREFEEK